MDKKETVPLTQEQLDYQAREKRIWDAIRLQKPDRVPLAFKDDYFSLAQGGATSAEAFYDLDRASKVFQEQVVKFNWDMVSLFGNFPGRIGEIIGVKTMKWAGFNLPDTHGFQFVEKEYMLADEYDQLLKDPGDFVVRKLWPRMAESFEPFGLFPPLLFMSHGYSSFTSIAMLAGQPKVKAMLEKIIRIGEEMNKHQTFLSHTKTALKQKGYPVMASLMGVQAPFDWISNYLRGIEGSMLDMYYQPDKLKAAIELITTPMIECTIAMAKMTGEKVIAMPLTRGGDAFMSNAQYAEFYWPSLKKVLLALIDAGLTPHPFWEGSYTSRLEFLAELPPGKIWSRFETIDIKKAKEMIGDNLCFWGNVPLPTLISGTPKQIQDHVKMLIDTFGDNGGLIVGAAGGIPMEAKLENVIAIAETVFEYGVY